MLRTILKPDNNILTLELPDDMVGTEIEVIAFSIDHNTADVRYIASKEDRVTALKEKFKDFTFNSGGIKFDRDEANDYE